MLRMLVRVCIYCLALLAFISEAGCTVNGGIATNDGGNTTQSGQSGGNGLLGWPFDASQGSWSIENGYNTGPDHHGYEQDSFDFIRTDGTTGQTVISPVTGLAVNFGSAYPGDGSSGLCVSIGIADQASYHLMVCHLDNPTTGAVTRGEKLGTVAGGTHGDHIHITLYYLAPGVSDSSTNALQRQAIPFSTPWLIAGCAYPADGSADQWANSPVPCQNPGTSAALPTTPPIPTSTPDPEAACRSISGFASATAPAALAAQFIINPSIGQPVVPFPSATIGYVARTFDDPAVDEPGMVYSFELVAACSPATSLDAVHSFFATQMPASGWFQSSTFPYGGDFSDACGDPYCWEWAPRGGDISRFASLEQVSQQGSAVVYEMRLGVEAPST